LDVEDMTMDIHADGQVEMSIKEPDERNHQF
jgi:hypothetical protein